MGDHVIANNIANPRTWRAPLVALGLLIATTGSVLAAESLRAGDARFKTTFEANGQTLHAAGAGTAQYRLVFTVYGAAFYVPAETPPAAALADDTPRHLEIEYFYEIAADDITKAGDTVLKRQLTAGELDTIAERLKRFQGWFEGVKPGDRYGMTYTPGEGTTLSYNGQPVGTVKGADFARAYFGIWLGERQPLSESLRKDLLTRLQ